MDYDGFAGDMVSHLAGKTAFNVSHTMNTAWATAIKLAEHMGLNPCLDFILAHRRDCVSAVIHIK